MLFYRNSIPYTGKIAAGGGGGGGGWWPQSLATPTVAELLPDVTPTFPESQIDDYAETCQSQLMDMGVDLPLFYIMCVNVICEPMK